MLACARQCGRGDEGERVDAFRWVTVTVSMVLGVGVARPLSSGVAVFRARERVVPDWIPGAWATYIFFAQLQLWWAIIELAQLHEPWTLPRFLGLVSLPLLLYVAAALVLPPEIRHDQRSDLREEFGRDGRWALLALSAYNAVAVVMDRVLWDLRLVSWDAALLLVLVILPLACLLAGRRRIQIVITVLYGAAIIAAVLRLSPPAYE